MRTILTAVACLLCTATLTAQDSTSRAQQLSRRAYDFYRSEKFPQALETYIDGLKAAEQEGDDRTFLTCTGYIGNIYEDYGDHASSLKYYKSGYAKAVQMADSSMQGNFLGNMVTVYCRQGDVENARRCFDAAQRLTTSRNKVNRHYYTLYNRAQLLHAEGRHDEAIAMHRQARSYAAGQRMDSLFQLFQTSEIGLIYLETQRLDEAIATARACAGMASRLKNKELLANAYKILADAYGQQGLTDEAETFRSKYSVVSDSVYDLNSFYQLRGRLNDYENEKMNEQISALHATIDRQWLSLVAVALCTLLLAAVLVVMERRRRRQAASPPEPVPAAAPQPVASVQLSPEQTELLRGRIADVLADVQAISQPDFSVQTLAETVRSNARYVSHVVNETYHRNFNTLLNELRIAEAARRLRDREHYGHMTIEAIYRDLGYTNAMSFNRAFKRIMGTTPSRYQGAAEVKESSWGGKGVVGEVKELGR